MNVRYALIKQHENLNHDVHKIKDDNGGQNSVEAKTMITFDTGKILSRIHKMCKTYSLGRQSI